MVILSVNFYMIIVFSIVGAILIIMWMTVLLENLNGRCPAAVIHLIYEHVARSAYEPDSFVGGELHRDEIGHEHQVRINLVASKAVCAESDALISK